jgi:molybdopterin converting factor small subunit
MRVRLVAFATAAEALGGSSLDWEAPAGTTLGELAAALAARFPALAPRLPRLALAVDGEIARSDRPLSGG